MYLNTYSVTFKGFKQIERGFNKFKYIKVTLMEQNILNEHNKFKYIQRRVNLNCFLNSN